MKGSQPATRKRTLEDMFNKIKANNHNHNKGGSMVSGPLCKKLRSAHFAPCPPSSPAAPNQAKAKAVEGRKERVGLEKQEKGKGALQQDPGKPDPQREPPATQRPTPTTPTTRATPTTPTPSPRPVIAAAVVVEPSRALNNAPKAERVVEAKGGAGRTEVAAGSTRKRTLLSRAQQRIKVVVGDITTHYAGCGEGERTAIVNAANRTLLGGGGVDRAVHNAAGPRLLRACRRVPEIGPNVRCETGGVRMTKGFDLPAKFILHTVGPVWHGGGKGEAKLLADCYRNSLVKAASCEVSSIAFPAISTGIYGYPLDEACRVAVHACAAHVAANPAPREIVMCCFDERTARVYRDLLR